MSVLLDAFMFSWGNQGFELLSLGITTAQPSLKGKLLFRKRWGHLIDVSFFSFFVSSAGERFVLTWTNILPSFSEIRLKASGCLDKRPQNQLLDVSPLTVLYLFVWVCECGWVCVYLVSLIFLTSLECILPLLMAVFKIQNNHLLLFYYYFYYHYGGVKVVRRW